MPRGQSSEDDSGDYRNKTSENQNARIHSNFVETRKIHRRGNYQNAKTCISERGAERSSGNGKQRTLSEQLADEARARRSEAGADRGLSYASRNTREKKIRNINTRDQKDCAHTREEEEKSGASRTNDLRFERPQFRFQIDALIRVPYDFALHHVEFSKSLLWRYSIFQTRDRGEIEFAERAKCLRVQSQRLEEFCARAKS